MVTKASKSMAYIATLALGELGGDKSAIHIERITDLCFKHHRDLFSWSLPEFRGVYPNSEKVRRALRLAKESGLSKDTHGKWQLTEAGISWFNMQQVKGNSVSTFQGECSLVARPKGKPKPEKLSCFTLALDNEESKSKVTTLIKEKDPQVELPDQNNPVRIYIKSKLSESDLKLIPGIIGVAVTA